MPLECTGRRIPVRDDGKPGHLERGGDYSGPVAGFTGTDSVAVLYLLPIGRDEGVSSEARSTFHVCSPPHRFIENSDGTLTIRDSIGNPHWHGWLTHGEWHQEPRAE
jgi:hypothetical protein